MTASFKFSGHIPDFLWYLCGTDIPSILKHSLTWLYFYFSGCSFFFLPAASQPHVHADVLHDSVLPFLLFLMQFLPVSSSLRDLNTGCSWSFVSVISHLQIPQQWDSWKYLKMYLCRICTGLFLVIILYTTSICQVARDVSMCMGECIEVICKYYIIVLKELNIYGYTKIPEMNLLWIVKNNCLH